MKVKIDIVLVNLNMLMHFDLERVYIYFVIMSLMSSI